MCESFCSIFSVLHRVFLVPYSVFIVGCLTFFWVFIVHYRIYRDNKNLFVDIINSKDISFIIFAEKFSEIKDSSAWSCIEEKYSYNKIMVKVKCIFWIFLFPFIFSSVSCPVCLSYSF